VKKECLLELCVISDVGVRGRRALPGMARDGVD